ncbi:MAG TPA: asparagine synthase (glutamine-hydrolyzing) [Bryobacteraceae bacterium]|nr:asparagine synthase (glutamine-hydrolyzing) [Bryobacteraceae bacterium]
MCGIAGQFLRERNAELAAICTMCDAIRHRGPDHEGYHVEGRCGIGMRRLSIIDLASGQQPICNEDQTIWVVFNGEIYNFQELRAELAARGHRFRTHSDTEVLVHLYEQEGVDGIPKLRGMFAYAIWDSRDRSMLLVRDRFGKKPLYYALLPGGLYFASELKCLRGTAVPLDLDREALQLYFLLNYIPDPWTPYRAIRKLPAGSWLRYRADGRTVEGRYWNLPAPAEAPPPDLSEADAGRRIREEFDEAVRVRLVSDVPLGAFLSGGIDSGSVVASMAQQTAEPVKTFSIGFEEPEFNELPLAATTARKWRTDHHQLIVRPDSVELVSKLVRHFDEPFGDSSAIPTYLVSEFAAQHVKVVLTGDGGDELFAGYESFLAIQRRRKLDLVPARIRKLIADLADALPYSAYGKNYLRMVSRASALERYFENGSPYFLLSRLLTPEWMPPADGGFLTRTLAHCLLPNGADVLTQALYFESTAKLTGDLLVKVDRMSMANSLEVRCPMLDHRLAELAAQIPHAWKLRNGRGKDIFIRALGDRLPAELLHQPKRGFGVPLATWLRGPLRNLMWDHLTDRSFLERGMVSPEFVRRLLEEHDRRRRNNYHYLWNLLMLKLWFRDLEQAPAPAGNTDLARAAARIA